MTKDVIIDFSKEKHIRNIHNVNLTTERKVDIYEQVKLNWNVFIEYLWENINEK